MRRQNNPKIHSRKHVVKSAEINIDYKLGMVVCACNHSTLKATAGELQV